VIVKQISNYLKVEKELETIKSVSIAPKREHPFLSARGLRAYKLVQSELERSRKSLESLLGSDPYSEKLLTLFDTRVGNPPSEEELANQHKRAEERYKAQVPPGYSDLKTKPVPDAYGDCIGWHQLMEIAKTKQKDIIFVIDDFKEDWWQIERERTVGPRPELLAEFIQVTAQSIYMYTSESFLRAANNFLAVQIREDVIEEVSLRLESQRRTQRSVDIKPERAITKDEDKSSSHFKPIEPLKPEYLPKSEAKGEWGGK
jgi:hypothetical protein